MTENIEAAELRAQVAELECIVAAQAETIVEARRLEPARKAHNEMLVLRTKKAEAAQPSVPAILLAALRNYRQINGDGSEVAVSRRAVDEATDILQSMAFSNPPADGLAQQNEPVRWGSPRNVHELIRQLQTLDATLPIHASLSVEVARKRRTRIKPLAMSYEQITGPWIENSPESKKAVVLWTNPDDGWVQQDAAKDFHQYLAENDYGSFTTRELLKPCWDAAYQAGRDGALLWQPIATAPTDGTPLLLFARATFATASIDMFGWYLNGRGWIAQSLRDQVIVDIVPSHWMHRPPFPEEA